MSTNGPIISLFTLAKVLSNAIGEENGEIVVRDGATEWMKKAIAQAKTGDSKSYAYLLPRILSDFSEAGGGMLNNGEDSTADDQAAELETVVPDIVTDVYTSDLTAWLNFADYNVTYLGQAATQLLQNGAHITSGHEVLTMAQRIAIEEIAASVIQALQTAQETISGSL